MKIHAKPQRKPKKCFFWICSKGFFAFVPLDLNFTNPKSTIFEPGWKTQPFPANHDHITKYHLMFFYKKNWIDFVSCARAGLVGNIGKFPSIDYQWRILWQSRPIKKWKQKFQLSHTFLTTKQNHNKSNHKKMKTFSIIFSLLGFIVKKKQKLYFVSNFPTLSRWPNTTTPPNITTKLTKNTGGNGFSDLHFTSFLLVLRQGSSLHD